MKKLLYLFIPLIIFSCSNGPNNITDRHLAQQCNFSPLTDSIRALMSAGLVHADTSHADNPLICDSVLTVAKTGKQNVADFFASSLRIIGTALPFVIGVFFLVMYIRGTSGGNNSTTQMGWIVGVLICFAIMASCIYPWSTQRDIKKSDYVYYMKTDGNLDNWWKLPAKSY